MSSPKCDNLPEDNSKTDMSETTDMKPPSGIHGVIQKKDFLQVPPFKGRRFHRKRRHSTSEDGNGNKKHRRQPSGHHKKGSAGDIILPTNFLLGGNISDPLNLNSLLDENVNKALNAVTPTSSPLPPRSSTVNIVIPPDMTDPLGLNASSGSQQNGFNSSAKDSKAAVAVSNGEDNKMSGKKKKKRRKSYHEKKILDDEQNEKLVSDNTEEEATVASADKTDKPKKSTQQELKLPGQCSKSDLSISVTQTVDVDPIVSPVIPQDTKSSSSASKQRKKRNSVICGKQLSFNNPTTEKQQRKNSGESDDLLLAANIDDQHTVMAAQLKAANVVDVKCTITQDDTRNDTTEQDDAFHHKNLENEFSELSKQPNFKPGNSRFQFGNYNQYYGYRNPQKFKDDRMDFLTKEWFKEKDVLDVGCNVGHLTLLIARDFEPRKIVGVDIDDALIKVARTNIRHYSTANTRTSSNGKYPDCMSIQYGPIHGPPIQTGDNDLPTFPNNVLFFKGNYVPLKEEVLKFQEPEYDVIICMSVTKWIHLNWGDEGLINTFQRFFKQLRPGGKLILEPQDWSSYKKKKKLTETIYKNFRKIKLMPAAFPNFLIKKIGFEKVEYLKTTTQASKGFQRSIHLYHKPE